MNDNDNKIVELLQQVAEHRDDQQAWAQLYYLLEKKLKPVKRRTIEYSGFDYKELLHAFFADNILKDPSRYLSIGLVVSSYKNKVIDLATAKNKLVRNRMETDSLTVDESHTQNDAKTSNLEKEREDENALTDLGEASFSNELRLYTNDWLMTLVSEEGEYVLAAFVLVSPCSDRSMSVKEFETLTAISGGAYKFGKLGIISTKKIKAFPEEYYTRTAIGKWLKRVADDVKDYEERLELLKLLCLVAIDAFKKSAFYDK
jgi:hypothetical protein